MRRYEAALSITKHALLQHTPSWLLNVYWMRRYRQHYSVHKHRYLWYTPSSLRLLTECATSGIPTQYKNTLFCSIHHLAWDCLLNTPLRAALSSKKTCNSVFDVKVWLTHYMLTPLYSYCYNPTCFNPQEATLRKYWYNVWAGQQTTRPDVNFRLKRNVIQMMLRSSCNSVAYTILLGAAYWIRR